MGDVGEFGFDGGGKAVAAVLGQTELFAVVGAEFDGHECGWVLGCVGCGHEKAHEPFQAHGLAVVMEDGS